MTTKQPHWRTMIVALSTTSATSCICVNCPCPLWLSKSGRLPLDTSMKVLAAIDPFHARAKPAGLDDVIMRYGNRPLLAAAVPAGTGSIRSTDPTDGGATARTLSDSPRNRLAVPGNPPETLALIAKKHRAGVIVMGAVSRSALTRFFIGNTAERVIDDVQCDVLVVKSPDFRTAVTRRVTRPVLGYPAVPPAGSATTALLPY